LAFSNAGWNFHDKVDMIGHYRDGAQDPASVGRRFQELI
jgi:hypothetical protein